MLQVKNTSGQLPQLQHVRTQAPHSYKVKYTSDRELNRDLLEAIMILEASIAQQTTASLRDCAHLLRRHQLHCSCETSVEHTTTGQLRNSLAALEVAMLQKDIVISRLKLKLREATSHYNEQLASIVKKKVVVDSSSLNYEQILKIGRVQPPQPLQVLHSQQQLQQQSKPHERTMSSFKITNQSFRILADPVETHEPKEASASSDDKLMIIQDEEEVLRLRIRNLELEKSLESVIGRLDETEKEMMALREQRQMDLKELRIVKSQLQDKNGEQSYFIKELNNRLEEMVTEAKSSKKIKDQKDVGNLPDMSQLKKALTLEYLEKEQAFILTERCYMQRIERLEQQLAKRTRV